MEIAEEDNDPLLFQLQQTLTDAVSTFDPSFFACSPLHFPTSNSTDVKARNPSFSSNINKENIDNTEHKSELQKLSLEPQTMKRKKKGGGYNLRKSLAWDRAFFTEEGVLNSTELSLVTGNFSKLSSEKLLAIEEEQGESLSSDSPELQALENNLFKELPCNNIKRKEAIKIAISGLPQWSSASASCSMVKQNVLSVHDINRSGSKRGGCPKPVMSSAQKRPANVSTTKAAVKEQKNSKLPAPKSGSSTARSSPNLNKPKKNLSIQAVSARRSIGLTGSNKSTRSTQNDAKSSLSSRSQINKLSAIQPKRNVKSSPLTSLSSAQSQNPLVTKPDYGLKVNQDLVVASGHVSITHEAVSNKIASLPQSHCHIGGNNQYLQPQTSKPSGLRMPSPSLGYFTQSKTIASHNVQSSTRKCNNPKSNIPIFSELGVLNSTFEISTPSKKVHVVAGDVAATKNTRDWNASDLKRTNGLLLHCEDRIQGNDGTVGAVNLNQQSHVADAQRQSFSCKLPLESSSYLLNASEADNLRAHVYGVNKKLAKQSSIPDPCIVVETAFQDDYRSHSNGCLLHGEIFSSDDVACQNESANSNAPCRITPALQSCVHEMAVVVECLNVENEALVSTDTKCNHDNELLCEATSSKGLERIKEDQETGAIIACDVGVSNDCQRSGNWDAKEMDDSHSISPLGLVDAISEPGEKIKFCHCNALDMLTNSLMDKQDDCEAIAHDELIQSSFEAGNAFLDNPILEACHGLFSVERKFLVESQNYDSDNCAGVGPRNKGSFIQAVEGPDVSHVRTDEPSNKCAAGDNEMSNGSFRKDECLQSINDGISFDNCKVNLFTSAEKNNNFAVVENLNRPQELQNSVSVMPEPGKFGSSVTKEISTYVEMNMSDNNSDGCNDVIMPDYKQSGQVTYSNVRLSSLSEDQVSGAENTCKAQAFHSLTEESTSSIKTNHVSSNGSFLREEVDRLENDSVTHVDAKGSTSFVEETGTDKKHVSPLVKPPLDAVPFSDEWLAAFEAAGEEILTMKSGAVQNSPEDKYLPEPGPWSPVRKKKNQGVGPFDCTKYTNTNVPPGSE